MRVDKWLKSTIPSLKGRHVDEAIEKGWVTDESGRPLRKGDSVKGTPRIEALTSHLEGLRAGNRNLSLPVVHETREIWVVDKPAGVRGHPLSLFVDDSVTHWALARIPALWSEFEEVQPTVTPHRLDTGTSGVLIVAKSLKAYEKWRGYFSAKLVVKTYLAWCWGSPKLGKFRVSTALDHDTKDRRKMVSSKDGLPADSEVFVKARIHGSFLAEITCSTGVMHQIRAHMAGEGFPLLGDKLYDSNYSKRRGTFSHHLLRAISLKTPEGTFRVPSEEFQLDPL